MAAAKAPVIRKIVRRSAAGHAHSSAWKVAYADFVTAMMAFFLMLWLIGVAGEETLEGIAQYFSDARINVMPAAGGFVSGETAGEPGSGIAPAAPVLTIQGAPAQPMLTDGGGSPEADPAEPDIATGAVTPELADGPGGVAEAEGTGPSEEERFEAVRHAIEAAVAHSPQLALLKENLAIDQTPEGLRIQLVDREQVSMFPVGSTVLQPHARELLKVVARAIAPLPNALSIRGHTDALPYAATSAYDNWRLSADRANATRLVLQDAGLTPARVAEIVGRADADPIVPERPLDPRNRRLSIVLRAEAPPPRN